MFENPGRFSLEFFFTSYFSQKGPVLNSGDPAVFQMVLFSSELFGETRKPLPFNYVPALI